MRQTRNALGGWLAAGLLVFGAPALVVAQTPGTAALEGRILDSRGEPIPGVVLTLSNPTASIGTLTALTDAEGGYAFAQLPPARGYELKASVIDYATVIAEGIELVAGRTTVQNLTLRASAESSET